MKKILVYLFILQLYILPTNAQAPILTFTPVVTAGLGSIVDVVNAGDGSNRLFTVGQTGLIKIVANGAVQPGNFLDFSFYIRAAGEQGLLSIAFHPNYKNNRYFFLYYNNDRGNLAVARMQTKADNSNEADISTKTVLLTINKPFDNHNGGRLLFGPDGYLYLGTGDGGSSGDPNNLSQNGNSLLGKMIRINVDNFDTPPYYTIPTDNPYISDTTIKDEIFSIGFRNPFRWSFDKLNGDIWIGDVGNGLWEEVNRQPITNKTANYGWRCYEGNAPFNTTGCGAENNYIKPVFDYAHNFATGGYSVIGGYVYRGSAYPALYGWYVCADFVSGNAWVIAPAGTDSFAVTIQPGAIEKITAFGTDENDELYAVSLDGKLYRVGTSTQLPVVLQNFTGKLYAGFNELNWQLTANANIVSTSVLYSFDGVYYQPAGNPVPGSQQSFAHVIDGYTSIFYRLKFTLADGRVIYSTVIKLGKGTTSIVKLYPTVVSNGQIKLETTTPVQRLIIYSMDGKKIFEKSFDNFLGNAIINLPAASNGLYVAKLFTKNGAINFKLFLGK